MKGGSLPAPPYSHALRAFQVSEKPLKAETGFREATVSEARFPGISLLGSWVNRGTGAGSRRCKLLGLGIPRYDLDFLYKFLTIYT